ncbi:MAG: hypothetical protein LBE13_12260, partial [Bacteroidales bacterium]|nr:hypothetical protein [Bacteroidales bacterium]
MGKGNKATDLQNMANILKQEKICFDDSPLKTAISELKQGEYNIQKLILKIDTVPRNTRPNIKLLEVLLNVQIQENNSVGNNVCI